MALILISLSNTLLADPTTVVAGYLDTRSFSRPAANGLIPFSLELIETNLLTDLYLAFWGFGVVSPYQDPKNPRLLDKYTITPLYIKNQDKFFTDLEAFQKRTEHNCNILLCFGGWGFNDPSDPEKIGNLTYPLFSKMASNPSHRKEFIDSCIETIKQHGLNGCDIDWEYPGDLVRGGSENDLENYIELLTEMRQAFDAENRHWILSVAMPATVPSGLPQKYHDNPELFYQWIAKVSKHVHRITLMAYDYHGAFDQPKLTGVNAPLFRDFDPKSTLYVDYSLNNYLTNNVPADKILLGMPLYGRGYEGVEGLTRVNNTPGKPFQGPTQASAYSQSPGVLGYSEIRGMIDQKMFFFAPDIITDTARAYSVENKVWVSFDNPETLGLKAALAKNKQLKGAIFWSIDLDQFIEDPKFPNIRSVKNVFKKNIED